MNPSLLLRLLTGIALLGVAAIHLDIAHTYTEVGKSPLSIGDQFYAQSAIAVLLTGALLIRPHLLVWLATLGFAVGSLAVLTYSRYKTIPVYGLPGGFMESWEVKGAKWAAGFESAAVVLAAVGTVLNRPRASAT